MARGIYAIRNTTTGKVYVGSSSDIERRWRRHLQLLRDGLHHSLKLQRTWRKHGPDAFRLEVLEVVEAEVALFGPEQAWIDRLNSCAGGYNAIGRAGHVLPATSEQKAVMSAKLRGRIHTPEARAKMSASRKGWPYSDETRAKISATLTGRKTGPRPPGVMEKMHGAVRGKPKAAEHRAKLAAAQCGRKASDETRAKMTQAQRERHARRKMESSNVI